FMTPDRRVSRFRASSWPAPWHLTRSFLGLHFLTPTEKLRIAWGLNRLQRTEDRDPPFQEWLSRHGQTPRTVERFWGLVLRRALNETPEGCGWSYARKLFVEGFLKHRRGLEVETPAVPLARLYGEELLRWLERNQVQLLSSCAVQHFCFALGKVQDVELRN